MRRTSLRLLVALLCALLLVTSTNGVAEARKKKGGGTKVFGVSRVAQDWAGSRLKVTWRAVKGATYQMRAAGSTAKLGSAKLIATRTAAGTWTYAVNRAGTTYVQVRAIKSGKAGAWSKPGRLRFQNSWPATQPVTTGASGPGVGQVTFSWTPSANTSDYLLETDGAYYGNWPGARVFAGSWLPSTQLSQTYSVPATPGAGDRLLAVAYGNPVWARAEAHNRYHPSGKAYRPGKNWAFAFPTPPTPAAGDKVRVGAWNTAGAAAGAIAPNVNARGLDVVLLQETTATVADAVATNLSGAWRRVPGNERGSNQIIYRTAALGLVTADKFQITNWRDTGAPLYVPWARFTTPSGKQFVASSIHMTVQVYGATDNQAEKTRRQVEDNTRTGQNAQVVNRQLDAVSGGAPIVLGGDLRYGREPFGEAAASLPAQPTLVRSGWYDTMAALQRIDTSYSTFNGTKAQSPDPTGVASRPDHILVKGIQGANVFQNVLYGGANPPSDHNLILTEVQIP